MFFLYMFFPENSPNVWEIFKYIFKYLNIGGRYLNTYLNTWLWETRGNNSKVWFSRDWVI